ncbi:MAG: triple tyrosine motif-containing protein, partial [Bacteroidota bacterium]
MRRIIWCLIILSLLSTDLYAQISEVGNPYIRNYEAREYHASSANYGVVQDVRGLMYFANLRGVLEYDGVNWRLIPVSNQSQVRSIDRDKKGQIFVGAIGEFGYLKADSVGSLGYESLISQLPKSELPFEDGVEVIGGEQGAFFRTFEQNRLLLWQNDSLQSWELDPEIGRSKLMMLRTSLYTIHAKKGLVRWSGEEFVTVDGGTQLAGQNLIGMIPWGENEALIRTFEKGFQLLQFSSVDVTISPFPTEIDRILKSSMYSNMLPIGARNFVVGTVRDGAFFLDEAGRVLSHFSQRNGLADNLVMDGWLDHNHSLWLSLSKGISRVELFSPIRQLDESSGLKGLVLSVHRHREQLYASTTIGVFMLRDNRFVPVRGINAEGWQLFSRRGKLFVSTYRGLYEVRGTRATRIPSAGKVYAVTTEQQTSKRVFLAMLDEGVKVLGKDEDWTKSRYIPGLNGKFRQLVEDAKGDLWLMRYLGQGQIQRVSFSQDQQERPMAITTYDSAHGLPPVSGIDLVKGEVVFATAKGLYRFAADKQQFYPDTMLSGAGILRLTEDQQNRLWLERFRGSQRWLEIAHPGPKGEYEIDSLSLKSLENIELWSEVFPEENGNIWLGTAEGLFLYQSDQPPLRGELPAPLIRKVTANDSILFAGTHKRGRFRNKAPLKLDTRHNSVSFQFAAPYFASGENIKYAYRLAGRDLTWSPWTSASMKEYSLLPPGEYVFELTARDHLGRQSDMTSFAFSISPPWYRSLGAIIVYGLLVILLIYGTVKLNTQRLHAQNEQLERIVFERTAEIWEQHKEIVKKTVALKRQKEKVLSQHAQLEEKNETLQNTLQKLKSAQSQLVESEKMASLGQLTAGIAHEINNPINYVKGNIGPLKRDFSEIRALFRKLKVLQNSHNLPASVDDLLDYQKEIEADDL